jgi:hypothetical protein
LLQVFLHQLLTALLKNGIVQRDGQFCGGCRLDDLLLECRAAVDADALAITRHRHAQHTLQAMLIGTARDGQLVAVVAHGGRADAIDDRALLGDAVPDAIVDVSLAVILAWIEASGCRVPLA